jgi:outer membrane protein
MPLCGALARTCKKQESVMKKRFATTLLATLIATSAQAYQAGDMVLRAGAAGVMPTGESDAIPALSNAKIEAQDAWSLGITFTYMATDNIGVGVLAAWPFEHDIDVVGGSEIASTKHLPPTVTLQYHFDSTSKLHPYVGAGFNYTTFFDEDINLPGASLSLDDSWGLAGELGLDYELENNWLVSGQVWYIDINTEASITGVPKFDVEIDPWVVMLSVGKKF